MDRIREKLKFKMADKNGNGLLDSNEEAARMVLAEHFGDMEPVFIELFLEGKCNSDFVNYYLVKQMYLQSSSKTLDSRVEYIIHQH